MDFKRIVSEDREGVSLLSKVATAIVRAFYDPILGTAQNDYMLEKFQSEQAISSQIENGYVYYLTLLEEDPIGFFAFYPRADALYLSKFYLRSDARGKGYGKGALSFICEQAVQAGYYAIELNVNVHNPTIAIYERMGFRRIRSEKIDIGCGYYMDDYVYRLDIPSFLRTF